MQKALMRVYSSRKISLGLKILSSAAVILSVLSYASLLFLSFRDSVYEGLGVLLSLSIPFFVVSFVRAAFDAPRPYEVYDFYKERPKERDGKSFPSRHAYSAFAIAVLSFFFSVYLGVVLSVLALLLCVARVLLGIHFIRDVVAGAAIGIVSGGIGIAVVGFLENV